ncbi:MAG TPA: hypothetical protein VIW01_03625 [Dehalococcoidia bacterium]
MAAAGFAGVGRSLGAVTGCFGGVPVVVIAAGRKYQDGQSEEQQGEE